VLSAVLVFRTTHLSSPVVVAHTPAFVPSPAVKVVYGLFSEYPVLFVHFVHPNLGDDAEKL